MNIVDSFLSWSVEKNELTKEKTLRKELVSYPYTVKHRLTSQCQLRL